MRLQVILEPNLSPDQVRDLGLLAEAVGIDALWVQNYATGPDPFMTLVPLALASRRIRLGVVVVSPQELHPLKLATALLTLHEISRGRAAVVMGRGGEWVGVMDGDFTPRVAALENALAIVRGVAAGTPQPFAHAGKHYRARFFRTPWRSQHSAPRVYAGVTKPKMLAMAARAADGIMLADLGLPTAVAPRLSLARAGLAECGRSPDTFTTSDFVGFHVKADLAAAMAEARRELIIRAWLSPDWLRPFLSTDEIDFVQQHKRAFVNAYRAHSSVIEGVPDDLVAKLVHGLTITGCADDLDRVQERVAGFAAIGLDELALRVHDEPAAAIRLIGSHLVPAFR